MPRETVKWDKGQLTNFTGRNGYFKCSGISALRMDHNNTILIEPLTSRGEPGRCDIAIPREQIPAFIAALEVLNDSPVPVECAYCNSMVVDEEDCESTPSGSMHRECAARHERDNPEDW